MRIAELNMLHVGSTGKIMLSIAEVAREFGNVVLSFSPKFYQRGKKNVFPYILQHDYFGTCFENMLHLRLAQVTGYHGCFSIFGMHALLRKLKAFKPDIIHLHNLHNWTINFSMLTRYIKKNNIKVIWTLHDCWTFTGQCPHYTMIGCEKWKTHCFACPQCNEYPKTFVDRSSRMYDLKQQWFTGLDAVLVTPSQWLADQVKQSFLKDYPVQVINNGIDLDIFKPMESNFRQKYQCEDKKIVLGVSMGWSDKKGFDVFVELASRLPDDYQIVLVGGNEQTDNKLPANVLSIHRTQNQHELAEIYSVADVFVNPTREETFPTVNIESLACGTSVITFRTGGSPEIIDETCGSVIECDDIDALEREIIRVCKDKPYSQEACIKRACQFDQKEKFKEYVKLYEDMVSNS